MFQPYNLAHVGVYYYPLRLTENSNELSLGEHTDYGILTILMQDDVGGLEILHESGQWIPVPPIPGTFVVNLGDMLEVWSNGAYKATKHRVRTTESNKERISMAFFFDPAADCVIEPLPLAKPLIPLNKRKPNANIKIPVTFGDYLASKYQGTFPQNQKD